MNDLVARMVQDDPGKRPTMDEVIASFNEILSKLTECRLRERLIERRDGGFVNFIKGVHHMSSHTLPSLLKRRRAMPTPMG